MKYEEPSVRFWRFVDTSASPCWLWTGGRSGGGYGMFRTMEFATAHRFAWSLFNGFLSPDLRVLHTCDRGRFGCVTPSHLEVGTQGDNVRDMIEKGRMARGTARASAVLSEDDIREIRKLREAGARVCDLARQFKVSWPSMDKVVRGQTWGHVK